MKAEKNIKWKDMDKSNIELSQLISHFEAFNWSEGKSPRTVEWYNQVFDLLLNWLRSNGYVTQLGGINEAIVRDFILYLRNKQNNGKPLSTHTIANRVRALRAFFSWLAQQEYTDTNILIKLKQPRVKETIIEPLSPEEINTLFTSIDRTNSYGARNMALLALFADTGIRLSEAASLKNDDTHLDQRCIKVLGKGNKERIIAMGVSCQRAMLHYYHHFRPKPAHQGIDTFFLSLDGYPIAKDAISSMMNRLAQKSGINRLHPHLLRHTYATRFLLNGGDVFLLKQNLGHSTLAMVERYRHIASREAAILSESFSPLDRINLMQLRHQRANGRK